MEKANSLVFSDRWVADQNPRVDCKRDSPRSELYDYDTGAWNEQSPFSCR